jgi:DNA-binding transcriptional LysR family regulator
VRTEDLEAFFAVIEGGGVTAAATKLELPKSTISRRLSRLEEELEAQLLLRTPRRVQVTELGQSLYQRGLPALQLLDDLQRDLRERGSEPRGRLVISAPADLAARHLGELCANYLQLYPKVQIDLRASNAFVDLIADGVDIALRAHGHSLADSSSLRARKLCHLEVGLFASPSYLDEHGRPRRPEQLNEHRCVIMAGRNRRFHMSHARTGRSFDLDVEPTLSSDEHHLLADVAMRGVGIATLPTMLGAPAIDTGELERVLPAWSMRAAKLSALWPTAAHTSPRIREFVTMAADYFSPPPWTR